MTICRIGFCNPDFAFQGLGGRKMIGQGWIFTVDNDKLYVMPNSVFHYFYVHRLAPSKKFHLSGWNHDYAPNLADFIIKVNFILNSRLKIIHCSQSFDFSNFLQNSV